MPREGLRSGQQENVARVPSRVANNPPSPPPSDSDSDEDTADDDVPVHRASRLDRYLVPRSEFYEDGDQEALLKGVVTGLERGYVKIWFSGDQRATRYRGRLETWTQYLVVAEDVDEADEGEWQELEMLAGVRCRPRAAPASRRRTQQRTQPSDDPGAIPATVNTWESDAEDDENEECPDNLDGADDEDLGGDRELERLIWVNCGRLLTDQRARLNSMPESITPHWNLANFRDENWLNWFLHYMPLTLISEITRATNTSAMTIEWPAERQWTRLKTGEFLRWLGLWLLMTVYPVIGNSRRSYWRGILNFGKYMSEARFEGILRAFALPQYRHDEPGWGGPARELYELKNFDPFFETRKFCDAMRTHFRDAMRPGGWLCIDESMFSWLGRALKLPGWKVVKRKPHPIGLEAKTTACAMTGMLIDYEFQEGKDAMGLFEFVDAHNKSTSWLLRLTKRWHGEEKRTVVADAAFAQVRAAVALYKVGGLFLIGNVKGARKFFPQAELREECGEYERDKLVCLTKKAVLKISDTENLDLFATGWRCTGDMVVTYVHTGGINTVGSDRVKRKYHQLQTGVVNVERYHVKRPKVSAEYQRQMGAIDGHNFRRQSGRGTTSLEKVCVTRNSKDRIFINIVGWIVVNLYLAKKYFEWGGSPERSTAEVQEAIAFALIKNQWYAERGQDMGDSDDERQVNNPANCAKHPKYNSNLCKFCHKRKTIYICKACSTPKAPKVRRDRGRVHGTVKYTRGGYMHFCKGECFDKHVCGSTRQRRPRNYRQNQDFEI